MSRKTVDPITKRRGKLFSGQLKKARFKQRLTQEALASKANVSLDTLRALERGRVIVPGVFLAADLVLALNENLADWVLLPNGKKGRK